MTKNWPKRILFAFVAFALAGIACIGYAYFIEPRSLVLKHSTIHIKGWNPAFNGLKVVMLGDIHAGSNYVTEEKLRDVVARTNEQDADLVVLLGDYVSERQEDNPARRRELRMPVETMADNLSGINAKLGVFVVLGNHDGWYGAEEVAAAFKRIGYTVLQNEVAAVERNGNPLRLLGFKDHLKLNKSWKETSDDARALLEAAGGHGQVIALEHSPDILPIITEELSISPDLKLVLAAHTHGGQVWFPILGRPIVPSSFGQKYAYGHIYDRGVDMFVTSGIGTSVLPIRFMVPPEIVVLTIRTA